MQSFFRRNRTASTARRTVRRTRPRPWLECLEDRLAPATTLSVGPTAQDLINAIKTADNTAGPVILDLMPGTTYTLTSVDNNWFGPNGLPAITNDVTISGHGDTIQRSDDAGTANFRLFFVSGGPGLTGGLLAGLNPGNLTLLDLTLSGGVAQGGSSLSGGGGLGAGGAIFNQGNLTLDGVTLTENQAVGGSSGVAGLGNGGGGMGEDAPATGAGGGFGGGFSLPKGPQGGASGNGGAGGGAGFALNGTDASNNSPGLGGGVSELGSGTGDGGDGGKFGGNGGAFGAGAPAGGGGGVGGGGGFDAGQGGGGGFGGGGAESAFGSRAGFGGGNGRNDSVFITGGDGGWGLGGAIFNLYGTITLTNSTLAFNTARGGDGGGVANQPGGNGGNGGRGEGGAIFNLDGSVNLTYVTLASNTATGGAGGASFVDRLPGSPGAADGAAVYNLAFGNDFASDTSTTATLALINSILSGNSGGTDLASEATNGKGTNSAAIQGNTNLVHGSHLHMGTGTTTVASGVITLTLAPTLDSALKANGGGTPTLAELAGSVSIGAGNASLSGLPKVDQRGLPRPTNGAVDLGSFQVQATPTPTPTPSPTPSPTPTPSPPGSGSGSAAADTFQPGVAQSFTTTLGFFVELLQAHFADGSSEGPQLVLPLFLFIGSGFLPFFPTVSQVTFDANGNADVSVTAVDGIPIALELHYDAAGHFTGLNFG